LNAKRQWDEYRISAQIPRRLTTTSPPRTYSLPSTCWVCEVVGMSANRGKNDDFNLWKWHHKSEDELIFYSNKYMGVG